jgi:Arc/MetJ-type ribon-helix-helix transcriptional regulator
MRKTVNISLSPSLLENVRQRVAKSSYGSVSEYVRELIRNDLRSGELARLREESFYREIGREKARMTMARRSRLELEAGRPPEW